MSDENATADAQAADADDTQAQAASGERPGGDVDETLTVAAARKLRSEHQTLRDRLKQAETKLAERDKADLTDRERLERDASEAKQQLEAAQTDARYLRAQVAAYKAGVNGKFLDHIPKLIDWDAIDDPSDHKEVERAVKQFLKDNPEMTRGPANAADAGASSATRNNGELDMNQWIRERAGIRT